MDMNVDDDRLSRQKKHKKHKHKKHRKHKHRDEEKEDQEIEVEDVENEIDFNPVGLEDVTITTDPSSSFLDLEVDPAGFVGGEEIVEEQLIEIDNIESGMDVINIEEMVLENYGQELETLGEDLEVDVGGMDDELLEDEEVEEEEVEDVDESQSDEEEPQVETKPRASPISTKVKIKQQDKKAKDSDGISSGEEAWLDALESGKLEEVDDELKKIKNPKLLTARQRALMERKGEIETDTNFKPEELMQLPTSYKEQEMTVEALQKKALKSQRRREVAAQKREKEKKQTIDRLLQKKQATNFGKSSKSASALSSTSSLTGLQATTGKTVGPRWSLRQDADGQLTLSLPPGTEYPITGQKVLENARPREANCAAPGCTNKKKYSCSKTGVPLCSLQCYKVNLTQPQLTSCT